MAGVDANFRFFKNLSLNGFAAQSDTPGVTRNQGSAKASVGLGGQPQAAAGVDDDIGEGFRDDLGFVRRTGVTRQFYDAAWLPQPEVPAASRHPANEPHARVWNYYDPAGDSCRGWATRRCR